MQKINGLKGALYDIRALLSICEWYHMTQLLCCVLLHWESCCPSLVHVCIAASLTNFPILSVLSQVNWLLFWCHNPPPPSQQLMASVRVSNLITAKKADRLHAQNYVCPQWNDFCSNLTPDRCSVCCLINWGPLCVTVCLCVGACVDALLTTRLVSYRWHCPWTGPHPVNSFGILASTKSFPFTSFAY